MIKIFKENKCSVNYVTKNFDIVIGRYNNMYIEIYIRNNSKKYYHIYYFYDKMTNREAFSKAKHLYRLEML